MMLKIGLRQLLLRGVPIWVDPVSLLLFGFSWGLPFIHSSLLFCNVSLYLLNKSLTKHLSILNKLIAYVRCASSKYQCVLVLAHLWLKSANLKVHFALVAWFMHLFWQKLFDSNHRRWIILIVEYCIIRLQWYWWHYWTMRLINNWISLDIAREGIQARLICLRRKRNHRCH